MNATTFLRASQADFAVFVADPTLSKAFCRSLEIIGEASKNVRTELKTKYPLVDWKRMAGIRDKIIHDYFSVDHQIIWDTIKTDIPELQRWMTRIIEEESSSTE